ncbi:MAG: methylmalonyl-CoA epimerase [Candidatus Muiribacteriota bacterium]|jgi:methylmalonyl-CoA epimerase
MKIDHIGIAVKSIEESSKIYKALGASLEHTEEVDGMKVGFIPVGGTQIELLESLGEGTPIANFIEKKGEGIHHLAFYVDNIEKKLEELEKEGYRLIDKTPRKGAHGMKIAFLHPKSTNGVLVEICEKGE